MAHMSTLCPLQLKWLAVLLNIHYYSNAYALGIYW